MSLTKNSWIERHLVCFMNSSFGKASKFVYSDKNNHIKFYATEKTAEKTALKVGGLVHKCGIKYLIVKDEKL